MRRCIFRRSGWLWLIALINDCRHGDFATSGRNGRRNCNCKCRCTCKCGFLEHRARRSRSTLMLIYRCRSAWRVYFGFASLRAVEMSHSPSPCNGCGYMWIYVDVCGCQLSCVGPSKVRCYFLNSRRGE